MTSLRPVSDPLLQVWDEAKRLRCEWYNDYEKGITKPPIRVSDLEVVELNFRGGKEGAVFYNGNWKAFALIQPRQWPVKIIYAGIMV